MRRVMLIACLVLFSAPPARAEIGWFQSSWQSTKAFTSRACDRVGAFTAAQGKKIAAASDRAMEWVQEKALGCTPAECQRSYGLQLPESLSAERPLAVLVHGLDSGSDYFGDLAALLEQEGIQVATFDYPNDQEIARSAELFACEFAALRAARGDRQIDVITHSMGGLVARSYVEGPAYAGGVDRLILVAPPNHGSSYSRWNCCSEIAEHFMLWRNHPSWHWSWPFIDGVGEAGDDMQQDSDFLEMLNALPRRQGVRYTVIAGNRSCGWRYAATSVRLAARLIPDWNTAADAAAREQLFGWAAALRERPCSHDGLVAVESARLNGVDDFVVVPGDHTTIACSRDGLPPAAWPVIKDRLSH